MENYSSNSNKMRASTAQTSARKNLEPVAQGRVNSGSGDGFMMSLLTGVFRTDREQLATDFRQNVLIPSITRIILDIVKNGIDTILVNAGLARANTIPGGQVMYNKVNQTPTTVESKPKGSSTIGGGITFDSADKASAVLDRMYDVLSQYPSVSVGDMYDLSGLTCDSAWYNYGWTDISGAKVMKTQNGWLLAMPKSSPIV